MKPHPRIRKTIKCGGAVVTVLLVVVWTVSGWVSIRWVPRIGLEFNVRAALVGCLYEPAPKNYWPPGWYVDESYTPWEWWPYRRWTWKDSSFELGVNLWVPVLVAGSTCALAWRLDTLARRRARLNLCTKCSHDRAGIAGDAKCPECGAGGSAAP
jgi:hypothetical protein